MLLEYLSRTMPADQLDEFEERILHNNEFSAMVALAEQELLEDYAADILAPEEALIVDPWVRSSPRRIEHVQLTRSLMDHARRREIGSVTVDARGSGNRYFAYAAASAACVLFAVLFVWKYQTADLTKYSKVQSHGAAVSGVVSVTNDNVLLNVERSRGEIDRSTHTLHAGAQTRLQLVLPESNKANIFSLKILDESTGKTTSYEKLNRKQESDIAYVELILPADALASGDYSATLVSPSGPLLARFQVNR